MAGLNTIAQVTSHAILLTPHWIVLQITEDWLLDVSLVTTPQLPEMPAVACESHSFFLEALCCCPGV